MQAIHEYNKTACGVLFLAALAARRILEIGTFSGDTALAMLSGLPPDGHLTTIDIEQCLEARVRLEKAGYKDRCTFITGNDMEVAWNEQVDILFIDSSHTFQHTLDELRKFSPFTKTIFMHDVNYFKDIRDAIEQFIKENEKWEYKTVLPPEDVNGLGLLTQMNVHDSRNF